MKQKIKDNLKNHNKPFQEHVYIVLHNSNIGKTTALYGHLHYKYTMQTAISLGDNTYSKIPLYDKNIINIPKEKEQLLKEGIN